MRALLRLVLFAIVLLASLTVAGQSPIASGLLEPVRSDSTGRPNVLVLTTYQYGLPIPDGIHRGILAALKESDTTVASAFIEHLDLARVSSSEHRSNLATMLRHKLAGKRFDIVIVEGSPVIDFLTKEGKDLFPEAVLLTLITPPTDALINDARKVIDIPWRVDPAGTLRAALNLFPSTRRVVVVTGALDSILPFIDEAKKALAPWKDKLEIEFTNQMSYEEMMGRIATLPANSLIIYSPYFADTSGRTFVPAEVVVKVSQTANAPVFGTMEAYLGKGIVGGSLLKTEDTGKKAGKTAIDYLSGRLQLLEQKTSIYPSTKMMFDWNELVLWKADASRLPENSIVINRPQGLWGQYKAEVITVVVLFLIFSGFIAGLLILNRRLIRTNAAVSEAEARFRILTEMSSDFYWESDAEHRLIARDSANKKLSTVSTFQRGAQIGDRRWEIPYLSPDEAGWRTHRAELDAHRPFREFEISRLGVDGTERHISISGDPVFDASGAFAGYRGVGSDITERKRSEQQLVEAEAQYRSLVEQSIAGIYIIQDGKFAYVNPRCAEIFGYDSAEEMIGRDSLSVVAEKDRNILAENMRRRIEGEVESINYEYTGLHKNGSTFDVGGQGRRAVHKGRPAVIGLIQDISEKKRAADEIKRYVAQLETAFMSTVKVATTLGEMRDPYTAGHQRRVGEIAGAIGAELGFDARGQEGLRVAGYLHDIGKITVPAEILSKPGKLSAIEYRLIQGHPQSGYNVLKDVEFPWPVAEVALQHHERMDGSGYPQGLKGEATLLEARIMAVADVVEAMSTHRPYRPGLGIDKSLAEIERGRGTAYDPDVADACLKLFREKGYAIPA